MSIKHRAYQLTAIASLATLITFLVLILNTKSNDDEIILFMSLFLFACIVFYYSSKKYIAYEIKKRKAKRSFKRYRSSQLFD